MSRFPDACICYEAILTNVTDASYVCHGYVPPKGLYHALHDPELAPQERMAFFGKWVSAYFAHGDVEHGGLEALESRNFLENPSPTITRMSPEELAESAYSAPGEDGGSEQSIAGASIVHGTYASLRKGAFHLRDLAPGTDDWRDVVIRYLWCDASTWEMPLSYLTLSAELKEVEKQGKGVRNVEWVRVRGANHFVSSTFTRSCSALTDECSGALGFPREDFESILG